METIGCRETLKLHFSPFGDPFPMTGAHHFRAYRELTTLLKAAIAVSMLGNILCM